MIYHPIAIVGGMGFRQRKATGETPRSDAATGQHIAQYLSVESVNEQKYERGAAWAPPERTRLWIHVLGPLGVPIEVKNQTRVHLWHEEQFGYPYQKLANSKEGIGRFQVLSKYVGVRPVADGYEVDAPNGLGILYAGVLTPIPSSRTSICSAPERGHTERPLDVAEGRGEL